MGGYPYENQSEHLMDSLSDNSDFLSVSLCIFLCMLVGETCLIPYFLDFRLLFVIINSRLNEILECLFVVFFQSNTQQLLKQI